MFRGIGIRRAILVSLSLTLGLAACGNSSDSATDESLPAAENMGTVLDLPDLRGQTIVINTYGGTFAEAFKKNVTVPFEKATGATVVLSENCCDAFEKQMESNEFAGDIVTGSDYGPMLTWGTKGMLKDDPRISQIARERGIQPQYFQDNLMAVDFYAYVLAWNTKYADNHPTNWQEFFDTARFKESRGLFIYPNSDLEIAELARGVDRNKLYPVDVDKSLEKLAELKKNSDVRFWKNGADLQNQLGSGEIAYGLAFSNRIIQSRQAGVPVDMTFKDSLLAATGAAIPKTAKNVDGAIAFLDFYLQPQIQADFSEEAALAPAYPAAAELINPELRRFMVTSPENLSQAIPVDDRWWLENTQRAYDPFLKWQTG